MKNTARVFGVVFTALFAVSACQKENEPVPTAATSDIPDVAPRMVLLAQEVRAAEAVRNVKRLQWAYGHYSELGLWYDFADLFADSGVGHYVQGDLNRDQIRALFFDQVGQGHLGLANGRIYPHISFSPVVDLAEDGAHAKGRFRILAMLGGYGGNATWFHGAYENVYVMENGVWKLNEISNTAQVTGNFTAGLSATSKPPLDAPTFPFHYESQQIGALPVAVSVPRNDPATPDQLASELNNLQQRLSHLDDEAAVAKLQHQYGFYFDEHNWDAITGLFAEQGTFEPGQQGIYIGKTSIRNALNQFGSSPMAAGETDEHILFQTYVSVAEDGLTAKARVDQLGMQGKQGGSAQWTQGIYENTFIKQNGEWHIQSLHYYPRVITDYAKGWGADAQPTPGASTEYPPDAPPSEKYENYPTFYIPAFHFAHPVTGRAPQYPEGDPASVKPTDFPSVPSASVAPVSSADLPARVDAAALQSQRALAVDAVENLVNAYAYYLDECMTQQVSDLFAEDGIINMSTGSSAKGKANIASALQQANCPTGRQENVLTLHHVLQPVIEVAADGVTATITARLWQVHASGADDDYYLMGTVDAAAIKQGNQWKLQSLNTEHHWATRVRDGWATADAGLLESLP